MEGPNIQVGYVLCLSQVVKQQPHLVLKDGPVCFDYYFTKFNPNAQLN
jgi:hypothetical protein